MVTTQLPVPLHAPLQPEKVVPAPGLAVRVTSASAAMEAEQVAPQSIPPALEVTVPTPIPVFVTASWCDGGGPLASKVAVTAWSWLMVTTHAPVPAQAPPHPAKTEPPSAVAVKVTTVAAENRAEQLV